jgi:ATP-dependent DNA helicase RecG
VFYLRELMEQLGMGTQKLVAECKAIGSKPPIWKVEQGAVSLTLFRAPEPVVEIELSERQGAFLKSTRAGGDYKPSDYTRITGVSERQARRELSELQRFGLLKKRGKGPATVYVRTEKAAPK